MNIFVRKKADNDEIQRMKSCRMELKDSLGRVRGGISAITHKDGYAYIKVTGTYNRRSYAEKTASYKLAERLGFNMEEPYYSMATFSGREFVKTEWL